MDWLIDWLTGNFLVRKILVDSLFDTFLTWILFILRMTNPSFLSAAPWWMRSLSDTTTSPQRNPSSIRMFEDDGSRGVPACGLNPSWSRRTWFKNGWPRKTPSSCSRSTRTMCHRSRRLHRNGSRSPSGLSTIDWCSKFLSSTFKVPFYCRTKRCGLIAKKNWRDPTVSDQWKTDSDLCCSSV